MKKYLLLIFIISETFAITPTDQQNLERELDFVLKNTKNVGPQIKKNHDLITDEIKLQQSATKKESEYLPKEKEIKKTRKRSR